MSKIRGRTVSMLIGKPFPLACISMPSTNIFRLKMFKLAVNVVSVPHFRKTQWLRYLCFCFRTGNTRHATSVYTKTKTSKYIERHIPVCHFVSKWSFYNMRRLNNIYWHKKLCVNAYSCRIKSRSGHIEMEAGDIFAFVLYCIVCYWRHNTLKTRSTASFAF